MAARAQVCPSLTLSSSRDFTSYLNLGFVISLPFFFDVTNLLVIKRFLGIQIRESWNDLLFMRIQNFKTFLKIWARVPIEPQLIRMQ